MTVRDDLVAQVEQALKIAFTPTTRIADYPLLANAAVDAMAVFIFEQLVAGDGQP